MIVYYLYFDHKTAIWAGLMGLPVCALRPQRAWLAGWGSAWLPAWCRLWAESSPSTRASPELLGLPHRKAGGFPETGKLPVSKAWACNWQCPFCHIISLAAPEPGKIQEAEREFIIIFKPHLPTEEKEHLASISPTAFPIFQSS